MSEKKINVKLLRKIERHILEEPRRLDMGTWAASAGRMKKTERPPCGTVACIAGWACIIDEVEQKGTMPKGRALSRINFEASDRAAELLGLDSEQATRLFDPPTEVEDDEDEDGDILYGLDENLWPERFARAYLDAETPQERAEVAAARIDHFIKTNGAE